MKYKPEQELNNFISIFVTSIKDNKNSIVKGFLVYLLCIIPWVAVCIWAFLKTGILK